jgi:hypothetical protein
MVKHSAIAGSILALGLSGAAWAQDGGMSPLSMTCADIAEMDEGRAEGAIYFVAGYENAQGMGMGMGQGVTGVTGTATDSATMGTTGTDATGTGTGTGTDTAATMPETGMDMGTSMDFEQIDAASIISACEDSPESLVSSVLRDNAAAN